MQKFTHLDFIEITEKELELKAMLGKEKKENNYTPKQKTINNILNYSKALSIRKSKNLDCIELVLN